MRRRTDAALDGIVRARRPIGAAPNAGLHDRRILAGERREDAPVVDELDTLRARSRPAAARRRRRAGTAASPPSLAAAPAARAARRCRRSAHRSRGRGCTPSPSCRPRRSLCARGPSTVKIHEHDGIARVVVPDVVMHLLEVPAVFAGRRARSRRSTPCRGCRRRARRRCSRGRRCPSRSKRGRAPDRSPASATRQPPPYFHESLSCGQVSCPGSPGPGIV